MKNIKQCVGYVLVFGVGIWCGGGGVVRSQPPQPPTPRMRVDDYRAVMASHDATSLATILSHLRLGEHEAALKSAELQLDLKIVEAATAVKQTRDDEIIKFYNVALGIVKWYRHGYPSQSERKVPSTQALSQVPDLPAPDKAKPHLRTTAPARVYLQAQ